MPKNLKRVTGRRDLHFITLGCYRRRAYLGTVRAFWQRRFYDFNVWSTKKALEKLEYMHENPVKRKLVLQAKDWPWSSWSHYAKRKRGLIAIDPLEERRHPGENPHP